MAKTGFFTRIMNLFGKGGSPSARPAPQAAVSQPQAKPGRAAAKRARKAALMHRRGGR
ncbi:hypothetical protein SAMN05878503_10663 [Cereibacter ovatus]|uniref:Uncharacterized protein n=1 Tax=Cereibacter ovatus TaxID=439529 RepID=A0A285CSJ5_9RHOB|nr:hypothetical protein [Cereibacter ovatus]SNX70474.1 hypothetical protein SAMN05878503_10663 [Cereibacter ovatus]